MLVAGTGLSGFLGSHVARRLAREPAVRLRALVRPGGRREQLLAAAPQAEVLAGELNDPPALRRLVAGADAVVHVAYDDMGRDVSRWFYGAAPGETAEWAGAAGTAFRRDYLLRNLLPTLELAAAARETSAKHFIYISSHAVYGRQPHEGPTGEEAPLAPRNAYTSLKISGEAFVRTFERFLPTLTIFRPPLILGLEARRERSIYWALALKIARGEPVEAGGGSNTVLATTVAEAVARALQKPELAQGVINLADRYTDIAEAAAILKELAGSKSEITVGARRGPPAEPTPHARAEALGVVFPGHEGLKGYLAELLEAAKQAP